MFFFLLCTSLYRAIVPSNTPPGEGEDAEDLTKSDDEVDNSKARKKLGLPEFDPDALPSGQLPKYLNLDTIYDSLQFQFQSD